MHRKEANFAECFNTTISELPKEPVKKQKIAKLIDKLLETLEKCTKINDSSAKLTQRQASRKSIENEMYNNIRDEKETKPVFSVLNVSYL